MFTDSIEAEYKERERSRLCVIRVSGSYTKAEKVFVFRKGEESLRHQFNDWFFSRDAHR